MFKWAKPGIFVCFRWLFVETTIIFPFLADAILLLVYSLAVGKHSLRKTPYLPSHICYASDSAVYLKRKLTFTVVVSGRQTNPFDAFFSPKNAASSKENVRVLAPPMINGCLTLVFSDDANHSHSNHRCLPRTERKSWATQRSFMG